MDCTFCKIIDGRISGKLKSVSSEWSTLVPLEQVSKGHILVIPKRHIKDMNDLTKKQATELGLVLQEVGRAQMQESEATGFNILNANGKDAQQSVFHLHFHIVPRYPKDNLDLWIRENL